MLHTQALRGAHTAPRALACACRRAARRWIASQATGTERDVGARDGEQARIPLTLSKNGLQGFEGGEFPWVARGGSTSGGRGLRSLADAPHPYLESTQLSSWQLAAIWPFVCCLANAFSSCMHVLVRLCSPVCVGQLVFARVVFPAAWSARAEAAYHRRDSRSTKCRRGITDSCDSF